MIKNILITVYILIVLGISATAKASQEVFPIFVDRNSPAVSTFEGEIAMTVDGLFYLVQENKAFELKANIDLTEFNGMAVQIKGLELKYKVGPVYETSSVDPLQDEVAPKAAAPVLVVLEINELVNN